MKAFGSCRLCLVEIDGRAGHARLLHHAGRARHGRVDPERAAEAAPQGRDGALHLRPSARLPDLRGQRRLRAAGHGRARSACATCATATTARTTPTQAKDESNPYFDLRSGQVHRLLALRARLRRGAGHVRADDPGPRLRLEGLAPARSTTFPRPPNACRAAPACRPARPRRCRRRAIEIGLPEHSVVTTCAYCGVGCTFKAEMRGEELVRMVPWKDGKANRGHSCVKGRFAWGYANHKERILNPMIRETIDQPWREVSWDEAIGRVASEFQRTAGEARTPRGRRHHLVALHQRRDLPRPEADPRWLRQQQRRYLRPRLPFADRLRLRARPSAPRPARRISTRSSRPTSCW